MKRRPRRRHERRLRIRPGPRVGCLETRSTGRRGTQGSAGRLFFHARERDFTSFYYIIVVYYASMPLFSHFTFIFNMFPSRTSCPGSPLVGGTAGARTDRHITHIMQSATTRPRACGPGTINNMELGEAHYYLYLDRVQLRAGPEPDASGLAEVRAVSYSMGLGRGYM